MRAVAIASRFSGDSNSGTAAVDRVCEAAGKVVLEPENQRVRDFAQQLHQV